MPTDRHRHRPRTTSASTAAPHARFVALAVCCLAASCASDPPDEPPPGNAASDIQGGSFDDDTDPQYRGIGFLVRGPDASHLESYECGTTLVQPDVAVTATHCIEGARAPDQYGYGDATVLGIAFGTRGQIGTPVAASQAHVAARVVTNPQYVATRDPKFDVAVLILQEPVGDRAPLALTNVGDQRSHGYLGIAYGGETPTTAGDRKRIDLAPDPSQFAGTIDVHAPHGGLCAGDSGSPILIAGTNQVVGVLDGSDDHDCNNPGASATYASLGYHHAFIANALAGGDGTGVTYGGDGSCTFDPTGYDDCHDGAATNATCQYFTCASQHYAPGVCVGDYCCDGTCLVPRASWTASCPSCASNHYDGGQCNQGWQCVNGCVVQNGCTPACKFTCGAYQYSEGQCVQGWQCGADGCIVNNSCQ